MSGRKAEWDTFSYLFKQLIYLSVSESVPHLELVSSIEFYWLLDRSRENKLL